MMHILRVLKAYWQTKNMRFATRESLEAHQQRKLLGFLKNLSKRSNYFSRYTNLPLSQWPTMDKAVMLDNFNEMNTGGLKLDEVFETAISCEHTRNFTPMINGITVGLSSGTSSKRGAFAVSPKEQALWAGIMLAKALPNGLFSGERVALFLRANSNLYKSVESPWLSFSYFDLFQPLEQNLASLTSYQPSIIVAPAQVLRQLALDVVAGKLILAPKRVISVAEVLEQDDREIIENAFGQAHEIYQATEGFLASTCKDGVLHLNEEYLYIEPQWLDSRKKRFVPIITDFSRMTQPIVRYRLDDILVAKEMPCTCGNKAMALERIEGRCDDALLLIDHQGHLVTVFSDVVSRALAQRLPLAADYRLIQDAADSLTLCANIDEILLVDVRDYLNQILEKMGIDTKVIAWKLSQDVPLFDPMKKRRRITRNKESCMEFIHPSMPINQACRML